MTRRSATAATVLSSEGAPVKRMRSGTVHPGKLNILPQVRPVSEYTGIEELADNIALMGLIQDAGVAELTPEAVGPYLDFFAKAFNTNLAIDDLVVDIGTGNYYVAILGHRRISAIALLFKQGCSDCRSKTRSDAAGAKRCMREHLVPYDLGEGVTLKLYHNIDPQRAYDMQMSENGRVDVSRDAEVERIRMGWLSARRLDPRLTKKAFAASLNRSVQSITDALRYCELPQLVRDSVGRGTTSYTVALELCRLQAAGCDDDTVIHSMQMIRTQAMTSKQAARYISNTIAARSEVAEEELSLFEEAAVDTGRDGAIACAAEVQQFRVFASETAAFRLTRQAIDEGALPAAAARTSDRVRNAMQRGDEVRRELVGASA